MTLGLKLRVRYYKTLQFADFAKFAMLQSRVLSDLGEVALKSLETACL
jgi:hypothetical protein